MNQSSNVGDLADKNREWNPEQAIEMWKYFGGVGAADKNTMITVESLLLVFSSGILGYMCTHLICFAPLSVTEGYETASLAALGLVVVGVALYVALLYGGYSNWNWLQADSIAEEQASLIAKEPTEARNTKWGKLLPPETRPRFQKKGRSWHCAIANYLGTPCQPDKQLPPIFGVYAWIAIVSAGLYLGVISLSLLEHSNPRCRQPSNVTSWHPVIRWMAGDYPAPLRAAAAFASRRGESL